MERAVVDDRLLAALAGFLVSVAVSPGAARSSLFASSVAFGVGLVVRRPGGLRVRVVLGGAALAASASAGFSMMTRVGVSTGVGSGVASGVDAAVAASVTGGVGSSILAPTEVTRLVLLPLDGVVAISGVGLALSATSSPKIG